MAQPKDENMLTSHTLGGPSGSVIASRLARSGKAPSVLLLEAGGPNNDIKARVLAERFFTKNTPEMNWGYKSVPQRVLNDRILEYSRGKGLGGSSAINFCAYSKGPKDDYEEWATQVGDDHFNWENAKRRYRNIESYCDQAPDQHAKYVRFDGEYHGNSGPLQVEFAKSWETSMTDTVDIIAESGMNINLDVNSGDPLGIGVVPSTAQKGFRSTASSAFLRDVPSNLTIVTDSPVTNILFEGTKAVGVSANGHKCKLRNITNFCARIKRVGPPHLPLAPSKRALLIDQLQYLPRLT
jgi:choline dehydrogenase-like flavoprotein